MYSEITNDECFNLHLENFGNNTSSSLSFVDGIKLYIDCEIVNYAWIGEFKIIHLIYFEMDNVRNTFEANPINISKHCKSFHSGYLTVIQRKYLGRGKFSKENFL